MKIYNELAIKDPNDLLFGISPKPLVLKSGMVIGGGKVFPELNFTLPPLDIEKTPDEKILGHYRQIVTGALHRAAELQSDGVVLEFETLPPMTWNPQLGLDICKILLDGMQDAKEKTGLKSALRMTPNDNREMVRPPLMRSGHYWEKMLELFESTAEAGADMLSIESVGGKELHDDALLRADISQVIFSLCILGARDMKFLWDHIGRIADKHGVYSAGDTACGFGNTAMVLAEKKMIPKVFAATVRSVSAVRSLVAYECGAVGPGKDCGYENPILKAITGLPMSMEGKTSACAHLSPLGNIAAATCDLWSNESVQNIKLLADMAPTCYMEQLIYDCRLMNKALEDGKESALMLRKWMVQSDAKIDPQAYILSPENCISIAEAIVSADTHYEAGIKAALTTVEILREGGKAGRVDIDQKEERYLDRIESTLQDLHGDEYSFIDRMMDEVDTDKFVPEEYEIACVGTA